MKITNKLRTFLRIQKRPKVFCIGYNKTGTTTMESVLNNLGYRMPNQGTQESLIVEELFRGNYAPLYNLCKQYDAFQDMPFSQGVTYAIVDAMFPGSKFILTVRDADAWFESLTRFHLQTILKKAGVERLEDFSATTFKDKAIHLHKNYSQQAAERHAITVADHKIQLDWSLVYNKPHRVALYERRNEEIVKHFYKRQDQLLILDISKEKDNSRIIQFLNLPTRLVDTLPHLNRCQ